MVMGSYSSYIDVCDIDHGEVFDTLGDSCEFTGQSQSIGVWFLETYGGVPRPRVLLHAVEVPITAEA